MEIIESLQLRSFSEADKDDALRMVKDKSNAIKIFNNLKILGNKLPGEISVLNCRNLPTDMTICLVWDHTFDSNMKSELALRLSKALKHFGWISYAVWEQFKEKSTC
jgi:hypothetical protein